jgi:hypothetical protein
MVGVSDWIPVVVGRVYKEVLDPAAGPPESQLFAKIVILVVMPPSNGAIKI